MAPSSQELEPPRYPGRFRKVTSAIGIAEHGLNHPSHDADDEAKLHTLLAVLYFVSNDFEKSKAHASSAIELCRYLKLRRTLPAFVYAASSLYDETVSFDTLHSDYFRYSVIAEPKNPLTPLLFSIYLDRLLLRVDQGALGVDVLDRVRDVMQEDPLRKHRVSIAAMLMGRYFFRLKLEQQKIGSITASSSRTIATNPKAAKIVSAAYRNYLALLEGAGRTLSILHSLDLDQRGREEASKFNGLLVEYEGDRQRLKNLSDEFEARQKAGAMDSALRWADQNANLWWFALAVLAVLIAIYGFRRRS